MSPNGTNGSIPPDVPNQILRVGDKLPYRLVDSNGKSNYKRAEFINNELISYNEREFDNKN